MTERENPPAPESGEVSEVASFESSGEAAPIAPSDATAGYPDSESGSPDEDTAGPDAPPRDGRPDTRKRS